MPGVCRPLGPARLGLRREGGRGRGRRCPTWISMWQMSTWPASAAACSGERLFWCSILKLGSIPSTVDEQVSAIIPEPATDSQHSGRRRPANRREPAAMEPQGRHPTPPGQGDEAGRRGATHWPRVSCWKSPTGTPPLSANLGSSDLSGALFSWGPDCATPGPQQATLKVRCSAGEGWEVQRVLPEGKVWPDGNPEPGNPPQSRKAPAPCLGASDLNHHLVSFK